MRPDHPSLKRLEPPKLTLLERTYLPQIFEGLSITGRHILKTAVGGQAFTVEYPEEETVRSDNYRGVHRLNKDENGRIKCVACMLCATACPAHCIDIVGDTAPEGWDDREKYPVSFVIDELRCIFCGMCEEACPVDAIELTRLYDITGLTREELIYDKEKLLSVFDMTKDAEPMRTGNPSSGTSTLMLQAGTGAERERGTTPGPVSNDPFIANGPGADAQGTRG